MLEAVPVQSPDQAVKTKPAAGVAWSPSVIGAGIVTEHCEPLAPQFKPAPVTEPPVGVGLIVIV